MYNQSYVHDHTQNNTNVINCEIIRSDGIYKLKSYQSLNEIRLDLKIALIFVFSCVH